MGQSWNFFKPLNWDKTAKSENGSASHTEKITHLSDLHNQNDYQNPPSNQQQ